METTIRCCGDISSHATFRDEISQFVRSSIKPLNISDLIFAHSATIDHKEQMMVEKERIKPGHGIGCTMTYCLIQIKIHRFLLRDSTLMNKKPHPWLHHNRMDFYAS